MSDATLDRGVYFSSSMPDWYRERPFKVAFAASLVIHATLITLIPSFRSVPIEVPRVLEVEIVPIQVPPTVPSIEERPVVQQKTVEPQVEPIAEPAVRQKQPEPKSEPVVIQPQPEPPPVPRAEIIPTPRAEPKPEFVVPKPELRPEPNAEPRLESRPAPRIEPRPEPPPIAQVDPKPEPRPIPTVVPRPEPQPEPRTEIRSELRPAPPLSPPPGALPRVEPTVVPSPPATVVRPMPPSAVSPESPPPIVATAPPQPTGPKQQLDSPRDRALEKRYTDSITALVQRHVNYPPLAKQRRWEGTTVLTLTLAPDGNVKAVSVFATSGQEILDQAALNMVKKASPLPRAPEELRGEERTVKLPISFKLPSS